MVAEVVSEGGRALLFTRGFFVSTEQSALLGGFLARGPGPVDFPRGWRSLDAHLPTLHMSRRCLLIAGTSLWTWTAFPPRANVGYKRYTAAWSRILRPTRKCGPCGFRWPKRGRNWLKRWSGYSREGQGAWMVKAKPKSRLEAPPMPCPRCKTLLKVRECIPSPGREFVDVDYRCQECGAEVLRAMPRRTLSWCPK